MQLSSEDNLRLNVLLAQQIKAVRIDLSKNIVYAITKKGEAKVQLSPTCGDGMYIKLVKELFSTNILGTPGGYPIFLKRWTRMGQANDASLENLLKLGEPEAVTAVIHAAGLTAELAEHAWWCEQSSANARVMLKRTAVAQSEFGKQLAHFLLEFLAYEERQRDIVESIKVVLQPNLISEEQRMELWKKAKRKNTFYVGFLSGLAYDLPVTEKENPNYQTVKANFSAISSTPCSDMLLFILSDKGQTWLSILTLVLKKPINQDVVFDVLNSIRDLLHPIAPDEIKRRYLDDVNITLKNLDFNSASSIKKGHLMVADNLPKEAVAYLEHLLYLSMVSEQIALPILSVSEAIGTVMRKQIQPITEPILYSIQQLLLLSPKNRVL